MIKEIIVIVLSPIILLAWLWYQDKKRQAEKLSNRLHNLENNVTQLKNGRTEKWKKITAKSGSVKLDLLFIYQIKMKKS